MPAPGEIMAFMFALGTIFGLCLAMVLHHVCAILRARRLQALIQKSTLFKFHL